MTDKKKKKKKKKNNLSKILGLQGEAMLIWS